jgi:SH3-like domain-containing protein
MFALRSFVIAVTLGLGQLSFGGSAVAASFTAVGDRAAILYDAPSQRAEKQFVVARHYPLEVLVRLEQWTKVRDVAGDVGWIENRALVARRFVVVTAMQADIRSAAADTAPLVFTAQRQVILEWQDSAIATPAVTSPVGTPPTPGGTVVAAATPEWIRVQHRDGQVGFVRSSQVWGH